MAPEKGSKLEFTELAHTGPNTGTISYRDYEMWNRSGGTIQPRRNFTPNQQYIIAARVQGTVVDENDLFAVRRPRQVGCKSTPPRRAKSPPRDAAKEGDEPRPTNRRRRRSHDTAEDPTKTGPKKNNIDVVLVSDIDWIAPIIFQLREAGQNQDMLIEWKFQNVPFVLEHPRLAGRRRPLRRHSQADPLPSPAHQDRGSHRGVSLPRT